MSKSSATQNEWQQLCNHTPARIALGRAGTSLPTEPSLDFQFAHALARDAVHTALDTQQLVSNLQQLGLDSLQLKSAAIDRDTYLQRPDFGRKLHEESDVFLRTYATQRGQTFDVAIVIADGLSALAVQRHAVPFLQHITENFEEEGWSVAPVCFVQQGRVAVADQVGEILGAKMTVILIGERPGLSSPDSLGLYFTYMPRVGLTDASRNCISNVRLEGLSYGAAAFRLMYLMREACKRQLSGVDLKDEAEIPRLDIQSVGNFLLSKF